jgi:putative endonuclease
MNFNVYILHSQKTDKFYVGQTNNLERRLKDHNSGYSNYSKAGIPWNLVFAKVFDSRSEAMSYEKFLKSKKDKRFIEKLIISG